MRDVAALAGVSLATVSRVVNGEVGVRPDYAERVAEAVDLLGYRPNLTASNLRRADRRTATIGLLLEDVANPFSSTLHRAVEDVARPRGTLALAGSVDEDPERERELLRVFLARQVDGLIVVSTGADILNLLREGRRGVPLVFVDRPPVVNGADSVTVDNRAGAAEAVRHLAARGHRRIAHLADLMTIWTSAERSAGYVEGLAAAGLDLDPRLVRQDVRGSAAAERAAGDLLDGPEPPSAIFSAQNIITIGVIRALQTRNLQHRVALIGFDEVTLADRLDPAVTVVSQDVTAIGRTAADLLFARIDGDSGPGRHVVVPTRLLARGSGEIPPA